MSDRRTILNSIRKQTLPPVELPQLPEAFIQYDDPAGQFAEMVVSVGGNCLMAADLESVAKQLDATELTAGNRRIVSGFAAIRSSVDLEYVDTPHELNALDVAVLPGQLGVAENGAVWVSDPELRYQATYFLAEHLVLVIPAQSIVNNMHEAYSRLGNSADGIGRHPFGCFISGPSKTADIEQSLVIGAQGPRAHTVVLVERFEE